ncbi:MAG: CvpA family protein [Clostridia bacterium]|nr:CvpA family protein [Clostridia bacterium]
MGYILDIIIVAIAVICIVYGAKTGFFKALMALISGIVALLIAFTFTPMLSQYISDNYIADRISGTIETTFMSIAETDDGGVDMEALLESDQYKDLMERAGLDAEDIAEQIVGGESYGKNMVSSLARLAARPIAKAVSDVIAFIILFVVSFMLLKIITFVVGLFLKFPVLKELDKTLGIVLGVASALFFVFVFAMMADDGVAALNAVAPGSFDAGILEKSIIIGFVSKLNPISALASVFGV